MKNCGNNGIYAVAVMIAIGCVVESVEAQTPGTPPRTTPTPAAAPAGRGRGPQFTGPSVSVRPETQPLARTQVATLLGWRVGVRTDAFGPLTFFEAAAKAGTLFSRDAFPLSCARGKVFACACFAASPVSFARRVANFCDY